MSIIAAILNFVLITLLLIYGDQETEDAQGAIALPPTPAFNNFQEKYSLLPTCSS